MSRYSRPRVMFIEWTVALLPGLLTLLAPISEAQLSCDMAIQLHQYAVGELESCSSGNATVQNSQLCQILSSYHNQYEAQTNASMVGTDLDQLDFPLGDPTSISPWQGFLLQSTLTQYADYGEMAYVLTEVQAAYQNLTSNPSADEYIAAWQEPWFEQGDLNVDLASNPGKNGNPNLDTIGIVETYFKASNYYFTGLWPSPFSQESMARATDAINAFNAGLKQYPGLFSLYFSIPFNNGTATTQMPGIFITPNSSAKLPLVLVTGGTDFPKETYFLSGGVATISRGYAMLVFDGPGQGPVIRSPPFMPFVPAWNEVLEPVVQYVNQNLTQYVDTTNIINQGFSLGGYLSGQACSVLGKQFKACAPNPPALNISGPYQEYSKGVAQELYYGFTLAGQKNASLLPAGYAQAFQNYTGIIFTLLNTCNASSEAPALVNAAFQNVFGSGGADGPMDPDLIYVSGGYGGTVSGDYDALKQGLWNGFRATEAFGNFDASNISVPVIGQEGTEDTLLGGQGEPLFALLPPAVANASTLINFDAASGAALHDQVGSPIVQNGRLFAALAPLVFGNSNGANPHIMG